MLARSAAQSVTRTGKGFAILGNGTANWNGYPEGEPHRCLVVAIVAGSRHAEWARHAMQCCHYDDDAVMMINVRAPARAACISDVNNDILR